MNEFEVKAIKSELIDLNIKDIHKKEMNFITKLTKELPYDLLVEYTYKNNNFTVYCTYEEFKDVDFQKIAWVKESVKGQINQIKKHIFSKKENNNYELTEFILSQIEYEVLKSKKELSTWQYDEISAIVEQRMYALKREIKDNLQIYKKIMKYLKEQNGMYEMNKEY